MIGRRLSLPFLLAIYAALVAVFWVGFIASDDVTFAHGAYGWIEQFPFVGEHGTIRYPLTIPMALSFLTLGGNEVAMALPSLLYMMGAMTIGFVLVRRVAGLNGAVCALLCLVTVPLFVVQGSIANVDMPELFFQMSSIALFLKGLETSARHRTRLFFFAGALAGVGFLTRETSVFIAGFYAVLFLTNYERARWPMLWIAAGFLAVWGVELLYLGIMTGDPFYRITIAMNHDSSIDRGMDLAGNFIIHPAVDPALVLLFNQEFMALFWFAIPAALWLMIGRSVRAEERRLARLLSLYGGIIFIATGAAVTLLPLNPRYFIAPTFVAALLLGMAIAHLWRRNRGVAVAVVAALLSCNLLGIYVENRQSVFGVRTYAALVENATEPVYTDPMTWYRAELLLKWNGAGRRAVAGPPSPGVLYLWNPALAATPNARMRAQETALYARPDGDVVLTTKPPLDPLLWVLETAGVQQFMPTGVWQKLANRHPPVELIRVAPHR